jgi:hypothetical protein
LKYVGCTEITEEHGKHGGKAKRRGWKNIRYIQLQRPDAQSKMTLPYLYTETIEGDTCPWLASQTDLLATDWELVP